MDESSVQDAAATKDFFELFLEFMNSGGIFMWIILGVFLIGLAVAIERAIRFRVYDLNSRSFMNEIQSLILSQSIKEAIQVCTGSKALLPQVIKNGLKRANNSSDKIQNAVDASALEYIPMVEKRLGYLNLVANISTLLGLLGTIYGLILSFHAVGQADPAQRAEILSSGISKAMNTTAIGLISAILIMVVHSFLVAKSEKIIGDIDHYSIKLQDILGTANSLDS